MFNLFYKFFFKPIAFRCDPEWVHDQIVRLGKFLGSYTVTRWFIRKLFYFYSPLLTQTILGITFDNPLGLSAGFDKNAELTDILHEVGFGFCELGSITAQKCEGNPKKRLWRLPKSKALVVNYGLKNDGAARIFERLQTKTLRLPVGISIAKTNCQETANDDVGIQDYVQTQKIFANFGDYTTINISCPNAFGGQPFTTPERLDKLLAAFTQVPTSKPTFVKLSPDTDLQTVSQLLDVIMKYKLQGVVCSNLTKNRNNKYIQEHSLPKEGGISGKVVGELANELIKHVYKYTSGKLVIIGSGGIFNAEDAYKKIRLGASLLQIITGMVFEGPQIIGEINQGLVKLLEKDGFSNISQAVGADNR